eukprot:1643500-Rhodomonas_salina.1
MGVCAESEPRRCPVSDARRFMWLPASSSCGPGASALNCHMLSWEEPTEDATETTERNSSSWKCSLASSPASPAASARERGG